jgi:hypothetical protein
MQVSNETNIGRAATAAAANDNPKLRAAELDKLRRSEAQRPLHGMELMTAGMMGLKQDASGRLYDPQAGETTAPPPAAQPLAAASSVSIIDARIGKRPATAHELLSAGLSGKRFDSHGDLVHPAGAPLGAVA